VIHVVGVCEDENSGGFDGPDEDLMWSIRQTVESLREAGLNARRLVVAGRPANMIVDVATDLRAELVIVGSRGRGRLRTMLLGSVSAEVVDHAPCPVLVVRSPEASRTLVAVDGSTAARCAIDFLQSTRFLAASRIEVLSVAPARPVVPAELLGGLPGVAVPAEPAAGPAAGTGLEGLEERVRAESHAAQAADRLARTGHDVRWSISTGGAAHEILAAAEAFHSDVVVMGSRGLTGLSRLVLGSVARNVLLHTHASVLIVHEPLREQAREQADLPWRVAEPDSGVTLSS
jgi:nucleotide-binding universal stress UspA family protein